MTWSFLDLIALELNPISVIWLVTSTVESYSLLERQSYPQLNAAFLCCWAFSEIVCEVIIVKVLGNSLGNFFYWLSFWQWGSDLGALIASQGALLERGSGGRKSRGESDMFGLGTTDWLQMAIQWIILGLVSLTGQWAWLYWAIR